MWSLLLAATTAIPSIIEPQIPPPIDLCDAVLYELEQGVVFGIITPKQATDVYIRCLVNYS